MITHSKLKKKANEYILHKFMSRLHLMVQLYTYKEKPSVFNVFFYEVGIIAHSIWWQMYAG